jgi:hypothetical protein
MRLTIVATVVVALALTACGGGQMERERQEMMDRWEVLVRWSHFESLVDFIHPEWLAENPVTELDIRRLEQFRVTEYRTRQIMADPDGLGMRRSVRIRMYHVHTQRERIVDHVEQWRYDEEMETWLLHSGLPNPSTL